MLKTQFKHNHHLAKRIVILLLTLLFPVLFFISSNLLYFAFCELTPDFSLGPIRPKIHSNSSIAFYIAINSTYVKSPDLRTRFWEKQLKDFTGDFTITYFSESKKTINGIEMKTFNKEKIKDAGYCQSFPLILDDFLYSSSDTKWFFFADMFTYINISNLAKLIDKLELRLDPMKDNAFAYALVNYRGVRHPSVLTGFLASNHAIHLLAKTNGIHTQCMTDNLNYAIGRVMRSIEIDVDRWKSDLIIRQWPLWQTKKKSEKSKPQKCKGENVLLSDTIAMNTVQEHSKSLQMLKSMESRTAFETINENVALCISSKSYRDMK